MAVTDLLAAYRAAIARGAGGFDQTVGHEVSVADGHVAVHLDVGERHLSPYGYGHGGLTLTLLDTAGGLEVWVKAQPEWMATINLAAQFLAPVERGPVVATARIDRLGKAVAHTTVALNAGSTEGPLLATAVASYRLFAPR